MKDRITTLLSALAALVLVIILLSPPPQKPATHASLPTSTNNGRYGLLGLKRWLDKTGVANMSLQSRYNALFSDESISSSGNLLISSSPATVPAREQELEFLFFWLSQGNDILLLSAHSDAPPWALSTNTIDDSSILTQLGFQLLVETTEQSSDSEPIENGQNETTEETNVSFAEELRELSKQIDTLKYQETVLTPLALHPLTAQVNEIGVRRLPAVEAPTRLLGLDWPRSALVILRDSDGHGALWEARVGEGRLWVSRFADIFGNVTLGEKDNAQLIANIIQSSLKPGGQVIFDDMHFGVSNLYDPETFFADSRLHNTLWFILGFWLLYVIGYGNRFMPVSGKSPQVQSVDFAYAVGGYFARRLTDQSTAVALFQHFFNDVRAHYRQPLNGEPVWELLQHNPRVSPKTVNRLHTSYEAVASKKRIHLIKLRNQLLTVRKQITL
ncbi:DUF4350 domain-containing protein [Kaarinaea lacus]